MWRWIVLGGIVGFGACTERTDHYIVSVGDGPKLLQQCTRTTPVVESYWPPDGNVISQAEEDLAQISQLNNAIENPGEYVRQYVGVEVAGRRMLYVNAIESMFARRMEKSLPDVHNLSKPFVICDGGDLSWGALYDIEGRRFLELAVNEVGG